MKGSVTYSRRTTSNEGFLWPASLRKRYSIMKIAIDTSIQPQGLLQERGGFPGTHLVFVSGSTRRRGSRHRGHRTSVSELSEMPTSPRHLGHLIQVVMDASPSGGFRPSTQILESSGDAMLIFGVQYGVPGIRQGGKPMSMIRTETAKVMASPEPTGHIGSCPSIRFLLVSGLILWRYKESGVSPPGDRCPRSLSPQDGRQCR